MASSRWPRVVLFGDSLTQLSFCPASGRWGALLAHALQRRADVVNRGLSGYNSSNFRHLLPSIVTPDVASDETAAATVFLGANDANDPEVNRWQAVPVEEYVDNLRAIVTYMAEHGLPTEKLVLIPPPPSDGEAWKRAWEERDGVTLERSPKDNALNRLYYDACRRLAGEVGVDTLDFWDDLNRPKMFEDGLHLSSAGADVVFAHLFPVIDKKVPKEERLPKHKELNGMP